MITLLLTVAGILSTHTIDSVTYDRGTVLYVEQGVTDVCQRAAYDWWSVPGQVRVVAPVCAPDEIFAASFD